MELLSGLGEKADQEGFLVAYPEGIPGRSFNTETDSPDDVGFTGALIDEITMIWGTDPDRVYATGMSNGAEMVYRLAAEMGGRLATIAPVSGAPTDPGQIGPATPMSLVTFTGTADGAVAIPAAEGLETWRERAGCSAEPRPRRPRRHRIPSGGPPAAGRVRRLVGRARPGPPHPRRPAGRVGHRRPAGRPRANARHGRAGALNPTDRDL
jgi:polyhydroxybutyrate depolymerase